MALTNTVSTSIQSTLTGTAELASQKATVTETTQTGLTTVATDSIYTDDGIIAGGATSIDLSGSLTDPLNNTVIFAKVMTVYIKNKSTNDMTIGGANNIPIFADGSDLLNLAAGAVFMYIDETGILVTAGTGDLITITGTNGDTFDLVVIGAA